MKPETFRQWRAKLGLSQKEAGRRLGLSMRAVQNYEGGQRPIHLYIALACAAVAFGLKPYGQKPASQ